MRATTIRFLDYWLGIPACAFLTGLRRLANLAASARQAPARPQKVLFLKFIEQGATVLAQDAIRLAVRDVGRDNVFFCVFESNRAILDVLETVPARNILSIRDRALAPFLADFLRAAWYVRSHRIDSVIDMEFFSRASAIFAFLSGARNRVGLHRFTGELPYRGDLMTHRVQFLPHLHISVQYLILVAALFRPFDSQSTRDARELHARGSADPEEPLLKVPLDDIRADAVGQPPRFVPRPAELERMRTRVGGATARPIVILNPNASDLLPLRKWPTERFQALAERVLAAYPNAQVVLTGAPSERAAAEALRRSLGSPRVVSVAGETSLPELLTLYSLADVLVTNDSGPGHFASLTPVHAVVLFGPETPRLFGPLTSSTVIWKELACSPCVSVFNHRLSPCTNNVCMQSITVDEVFDAVTAAVASSDLSPK